MTCEILIFIIEFNNIEMQQQLLLAQPMTSLKVFKQRHFNLRSAINCMCMYMNICTYVCIYAHWYVGVYVCIYVPFYVCMYLRICTYVCIYVCMYVYMYVCVFMCVCMYICMSVGTYIL